ncbi:2-polyprenyl-3-methyl-5-hydroxy-6-metoxy-1,4-benzoquinol methylase [Clostridium beijerinckii]|uniref:class I SAM-dependent methyltransferase n=1 Tax=Clostridium beijerinckii TaxID=1520 RepID=UPI00149442A1|nr:2-polyprenyl-3-methyl-5-hydroxy-6-metoxy-1,4-benzoquinol methylase [Clostridium beijerinckii]
MNLKSDIFEDLSYEKFKELAKNDKLNNIEKVGFPIEYRQDKEKFIFDDIVNKLGIEDGKNKTILDIGCGCSNLTLMLIEYCKTNNHRLILIDSEEMLNNLPEYDFVLKVKGYYPKSCEEFIENYREKIDCIIIYSVIQYAFTEQSIFDFVDTSLTLLKELGAILIGDIPNISKRKRFFSSNQGIKYHQNFTGTKEQPIVKFNNIEAKNMDDSVVMSIIQRCRLAGFDSYILPQDKKLPMANRREDILIIRP